jgi:hypothetical protein
MALVGSSMTVTATAIFEILEILETFPHLEAVTGIIGEKESMTGVGGQHHHQLGEDAPHRHLESQETTATSLPERLSSSVGGETQETDLHLPALLRLTTPQVEGFPSAMEVWACVDG